MSPEESNKIYDVLVSTLGASESERFRFNFEMARPNRTDEWRFCGKLGFGGKLYIKDTHLYVGCYPEDFTDNLQKLIDEANFKLNSLVSLSQSKGDNE